MYPRFCVETTWVDVQREHTSIFYRWGREKKHVVVKKQKQNAQSHDLEIRTQILVVSISCVRLVCDRTHTDARVERPGPARDSTRTQDEQCLAARVWLPRKRLLEHGY